MSRKETENLALPCMCGHDKLKCKAKLYMEMGGGEGWNEDEKISKTSALHYSTLYVLTHELYSVQRVRKQANYVILTIWSSAEPQNCMDVTNNT